MGRVVGKAVEEGKGARSRDRGATNGELLLTIESSSACISCLVT